MRPLDTQKREAVRPGGASQATAAKPQHGRTAHAMEGSMDEAERIAREAHKHEYPNGPWSPEGDGHTLFERALMLAARLGIEHGERESAEKIADMKATLEKISVYNSFSGHIAVECLARNFPAPKPSLREAAQDLCRIAGEVEGAPGLTAVRREALSALRDALAREEGKP